jgi:Putative transposase
MVPKAYSKRPFGGPAEVLRYLARYTHRVATSNRRLVALNDKGATFKWKDYRLEALERRLVRERRRWSS